MGINSLYEKVFLYGINLSYLLYIGVLIGVGGYAPKYLIHLRTFLKFYIAILLIFLYNPITFRKKKFREFDRKLIFSSGVFLLLSSTIISGIENYARNAGTTIIKKFIV